MGLLVGPLVGQERPQIVRGATKSSQGQRGTQGWMLPTRYVAASLMSGRNGLSLSAQHSLGPWRPLPEGGQEGPLAHLALAPKPQGPVP